MSSRDGIPRFNMPLELGLALYRSKSTPKKHQVCIFEQENYRIQRSTSDLNGIDPYIHNGTPDKIMSNLRSAFQRQAQVGGGSKAPEMMKSLRYLQSMLPAIRKNAGTDSVYEAAIYYDIVLALTMTNQPKSRRLS